MPNLVAQEGVELCGLGLFDGYQIFEKQQEKP